MSKPLFDDTQILNQIVYKTPGTDQTAWWTQAWREDRLLLSYSIPTTSPDPSTLDGGGSGENAGFANGTAMRTAWKSLAVQAFELWDDLIKPSMIEINSPYALITMAWSDMTANGGNYMAADLVLSSRPASTPWTTPWELNQAQIWMDSTDDRFDAVTPARGGEAWETLLLHEIGHALGLFHPGDYDSSDPDPTTYADDAEFQQETVRLSLMSYWRETADTVAAADWNGGFADTPMVYDILAVQSKYGADTDTRKGNDTYGFNPTGNLKGSVYAFGEFDAPILSIYDAAGIDTLDLSGFINPTAMRINLTPGSYSDFAGMRLNFGIAFNTWIENVVGGALNDTIQGNDANNTIIGGGGADSMNGGFGSDTASYKGSLIGVLADLLDPARNTGMAAGDRYVSIENLTGANAGDSLYGTDGANILAGANGHDLLYGRGGVDSLYGDAGNDTLDGGAGGDLLDGGVTGFDFVSYASSFGVEANLAANAGPSFLHGTGDALLDWYVSIEGLIGSNFADRLIGIATNNELRGGGGNDELIGGAGNDTLKGENGNDTFYGEAGNDCMDGGFGVDFVDYSAATAGINVSLKTGGPAGTGAAESLGDILRNIERIGGSAHGDTIAGSDAADTIDGWLGYDRLTGNKGDDRYLIDLTQVHVSGIWVGGFWDTVTEAAGGGIDTVVTRRQADRFGQFTVASYTLPAEVENLVIDGSLGFTLVGNILANWLTGGSGNDSLIAGDAADTLDGGLGWDTHYGEFGNDVYVLGDVFDWYSGAIYVGTFRDDVLEPLNGGIDTVYTTAAWSNALGRLVSTYTLVANVENGIVVGASNFELVGNVLANALTGGDGNDRLVAGDGADTLTGGPGADTLFGEFDNDTYVLTDVSAGAFGPVWDTVLEAAAGGVDTVLVQRAARPFPSSGFVEAYLLPDFIENGTVTGADPFTLTGNTLANRLTGNAAANFLVGQDGHDSIVGNAGDDALNGGFGNDNLNGGAGADTLDGGPGRDTLVGGTDNDVYVLAAPPDVDVISGFVSGQDRILLGLAAFDPGGALGLATGSLAAQPGRFLANTTGLADTAGLAQFIYETDAGRLYFDADGTGAAARVQVAGLAGLPVLAATDLWLG